MNGGQVEAKIRYMDTVESKEVQFTAFPYMPKGKVCLLVGDPGLGKSTLALSMAAALSTNRPIMELGNEPIQGKTIYLSAEDTEENTLKPRLVSNGADSSQIAVIDNLGFDIYTNSHILEDAIVQTQARLMVIDPLIAYIGESDMNRGTDMRRITTKLAILAEKYDCTILIISHLTKAKGKSLYRSIGSIEIAAAARSIMLVERSEEDPEVRLLSHVKSNLAPEGATLLFHIEGKSKVRFLGEYGDDSAGAIDNKRNHATAVLLSLLSNGPMPSTDVHKACADTGISERTMNRAKSDLGIQSVRKTDGWYWMLPQDE